MLNGIIIFVGLLATAIYVTHLIIRPKQLRQESPNSNNEPVFLLSADANEYSVTLVVLYVHKKDPLIYRFELKTVPDINS